MTSKFLVYWKKQTNWNTKYVIIYFLQEYCVRSLIFYNRILTIFNRRLRRFSDAILLFFYVEVCEDNVKPIFYFLIMNSCETVTTKLFQVMKMVK